MKKVLIGLMVLGSFVFASEGMSGCVETKLNEAVSIYSCPSGDYKAIFETNRDGSKRVGWKEPTIEVLSTKGPTTINQYTQK
ncbi:MAG: hypothetical protein WA916_08855 [Arcobacter sp.]|uniref:hypothetical protein n=1 Tax=Arcobacter sp. TaxID=1872629 RepID=UPI003C728D6D